MFSSMSSAGPMVCSEGSRIRRKVTGLQNWNQRGQMFDESHTAARVYGTLEASSASRRTSTRHEAQPLGLVRFGACSDLWNGFGHLPIHVVVGRKAACRTMRLFCLTCSNNTHRIEARLFVHRGLTNAWLVSATATSHKCTDGGTIVKLTAFLQKVC